MNHDSEVIQRSWLRLLQELIPDTSLKDVEVVRQGLEPRGDSSGEPSSNLPNLFTPQDANSDASSHFESETISSQTEFLLKFGDIPAVQDRFHTLLKHRLQTEIQRNPPLFPWESEILNYETEPVTSGVLRDETVGVGVPATRQRVPVWFSQLKNFNLPVPMPEAVLVQLMQRCQDVMQSSLLEGAKLVRAVEDLFPDQSQALNHLAGLVMTSPARSGAMTTPQSGANYPTSYEAAVPAQQMVLSLLAAREIMSALTLSVSQNQPKIERQWLTEAGALTLQVEYDQLTSRVRVQGTLPCGGSLALRDDSQPDSINSSAIAQRATVGYLSVELFDFRSPQPYTLDVQLTEQDPTPLTFSIVLEG